MAAIHGYTAAFTWAAAIFALGLILALLILPQEARLAACSLKNALARRVAYGHHTPRPEPVALPAATRTSL